MQNCAILKKDIYNYYNYCYFAIKSIYKSSHQIFKLIGVFHKDGYFKDTL